MFPGTNHTQRCGCSLTPIIIRETGNPLLVKKPFEEDTRNWFSTVDTQIDESDRPDTIVTSRHAMDYGM